MTALREAMKQEVAHRTLATELYEIERTIALFTERSKVIRAQLLDTLKEQGVRRVDLEGGASYIVAHRDTLVIKNETSALKWALENAEARMVLDKSAAIKVAKSNNLKWCRVEPTDYLRISRPRPGREE